MEKRGREYNRERDREKRKAIRMGKREGLKYSEIKKGSVKEKKDESRDIGKWGKRKKKKE